MTNHKIVSLVRDLPEHEKPREKLTAKGAINLRDRELLAILLRTGRAGKSALEAADHLIVTVTEEKDNAGNFFSPVFHKSDDFVGVIPYGTDASPKISD